MLYRYAVFSRKHNTFHILLLFTILLISFVHLSVLLETDNTWLLWPMMIYLPGFCFGERSQCYEAGSLINVLVEFPT
ncbi:hypothetical protein [Klebsiella oxytoca]|uniref:hypothetical protein n=1 Tax=Klebsiella oxytoca TaxID=571 RepID=UPI003B01A42D